MNVFPLSEGTYTVDDTKTFIPFDALHDRLEDRPGSLLVDIVPFLIKTKNDLVLMDPGLGLESPAGDFWIHENIKRSGFSPDDITLVLLSHLHKDHCGGVCYGKNGVFNLMFPRALYYCQEKELAYALAQKNSPSYEYEKLTFLQHSPNLVLQQGDGIVSPGIRCEVSGGHTPWHQVFLTDQGNGIFFFGGDVVPQPSQIIRRFVAKYDYDGKRSASRRQEYAERGVKEGWVFLFFHDAKVAMAKLALEKKHYSIGRVKAE